MIAATGILYSLAAAQSAATDMPPSAQIQTAPPPPPVFYAPPAPPPPPPRPRSSKWRPVYPAGNPGSWVTTNDYPAAALREFAQGITGFRLVIGRDGRVSDCSITASSGSNDLDAATCRLISQRARFEAARDDRGKPTEGTYSNRVRWVIPNDRNPPEPGVLIRSYAIQQDGTMSDCRVVASSGSARYAFHPGPYTCETYVNFVPPRDVLGNPLRKRVIQTVEIKVDDAP
jgi:TonB family protein